MRKMPKDFNLGLVFLSYLVAVTASHVTLLLAARVRDPHATNWKLWVVSGGFAMGIGIWSMHFVATLALKLPIRVLYDLSITALSWVFAIVACGAAFIVLRRLTGKHREFLLPGALIGIGIASMHYTGDASMRLSPGIRYDPLLFVASILIAIGAATAALWIAFHLARQRAVFTNFGAALVMGAAVVGMHFTAVAAAKFHPDVDLPRLRAAARRGVDGLHHRRLHVRHPDRDDAAFGVRRAPLLGHRRRRGEAAAGERAARAARARAHRGAAPVARCRARRLGGEERLRRHHEPRDPHADERDDRHARAAVLQQAQPRTSAKCCPRRANRAARCSR